MKEITAIVPIKNNSKRIPDKNFKLFDDKPLMYWILNTLNKVKNITRIVINTDSKKAIEISKKYFGNQIEIIERPKQLCGDKISINKIIDYTINLDRFKNENYFLQTHCTNPLLTPKTINDSISIYFNNISSEYDSLVGVNRIQQRCYDHNSEPLNFKIGNLKRTQDLKPIFEINANIYIFSRTSFNSNNFCRIGEEPYLFEINKLESLDIDYPEEFKLAEMIFKLKNRSEV